MTGWHVWWKRSGARELRRIFMEEWDPIGVRGVREAADEYDTYVGQGGRRRRAGARVGETADYTTWVEQDHMGLGPSDAVRPRNQAFAARLKAWYAEAMTSKGS